MEIYLFIDVSSEIPQAKLYPSLCKVYTKPANECRMFLLNQIQCKLQQEWLGLVYSVSMVPGYVLDVL